MQRKEALRLIGPTLIPAALLGCGFDARVGALAPEPARPDGPTAAPFACDAAIDFGAVAPGAQYERVAYCRFAPGKGGVIDAVTTDVPTVRIEPWMGGSPAVLPSAFEGQVLEIRAVLDAGTVGAFRGQVKVLRQGEVPTNIALQGRVDPNLACALVVSPPVLDFGPRDVLGSSQSLVRIENTGTGTCAVERFAFLEGSDSAFRVVSAPEIRIPPRAHARVEVAFNPDERGALQAVLGAYGDREHLLTAVPMRGFGRSADRLPVVRPSVLDFGQRGVECTNVTSRSFEVLSGSEPLELSFALSEPSDPSFALYTHTATLGAGQSLRVPVDFLPDRVGSHHARLRISGRGVEPIFVELFGDAGETSITEQRFRGLGPYSLAGPPVHGTTEVWMDGRTLPQTFGGRVVWAIDYILRELMVSGAPTSDETELEVRFEQVCTLASCGDGVVDPGESCDDGNQIQTDGCLPGCVLAHCGDGVIRSGSEEECDDGNTLSGDGCNAVCLREWCGNGVLEGDEQCDSGDARSDTDPDACRLDCRYPSCGDGVVDSFEACDDANQSTTDDCVACRRAVCGDGHVQEDVEECDDANQVTGDRCNPDCTEPIFEQSVTGFEVFPLPPLVPPVSFSGRLFLPFAFNFLGHAVTTIDASQAGVLVFGPGSTSRDNAGIPSALGPNGLLAWWWDDLEIVGPTFAWWYGLPGERVVILRYDDVLLRASDRSFGAQISLYERSGAIIVHYGQTHGLDGGGTASVGWESMDGLRGEDALGCTPHCTPTEWPQNEVHLYRPR